MQLIPTLRGVSDACGKKPNEGVARSVTDPPVWPNLEEDPPVWPNLEEDPICGADACLVTDAICGADACLVTVCGAEELSVTLKFVSPTCDVQRAAAASLAPTGATP